MIIPTKNRGKGLLRVFTAFCCAFVLLNILCTPYYIMPGQVSNTLGNTNYMWQENAVWMQMTGGISYGRADE